MRFLRELFLGRTETPRVAVLKRFDLISRVGQGTMSKVWKARDSLTGRVVALKVLDKEKTRKLEERFVNLQRPPEGEMAVTLEHPHIVKTFEHGLTTDNEQFLVMEWLEGVSLTVLVDLQNERMQARCVDYMIQLGSALGYVHQRQFIHRDICPRNVIVTDDDVVKLIDFGLMVPNTPPFQAPGNRTGTVSYMAPELIKRQRTDQRIDVFSLAVTCYEMLTQKYPWGDAKSLEAAIQHINSPPRPLRDVLPGVDVELAEIIMRGLVPDPAGRWQKVTDMVRSLERVVDRWKTHAS